ncbi:MAG: iron-sulfur cluster assembly scaffold protein [Deltaproteobacteria bacterium]|nr:iron-sulfur cluster assembly scaffold protein [Deltaproteobacteria bacterium]MBW2082632.1 iron-sulfur cluster assembly scaffold protein [Deltaproteobacteria bacterium]HDM09278.1 iron-sulfur cluster assembly scaffold protein [Desulfobacteraceae bacterium]
MANDLDDFVCELQEQIYEETRKAYGEDGFERWLNMRYMGRMPNPDGYARLTGNCGDTMEIFLKFEDGRVKEASFLTDGCGSSAVCGSFAAEMALEKTPDELLDVTGEAILERLGGLPKEEEHCAYLAGETLQEALNDYMTKQVKKG